MDDIDRFLEALAGGADRIEAAGVAGAFALLSGFTYAVTDEAGGTRVLRPPHLWGGPLSRSTLAG